MRPVCGHTCLFQTFVHTFPYLIGGDAHVFGAESHIFLDDTRYDLVVGILEDHARFLAQLPQFRLLFGIRPIYPECTLRREKQRIDMFSQCGFSRAVMPQDRNKFTRFYIQINIIDRTVGLCRISVIVIFKVVKRQLQRFDYSHSLPPRPPKTRSVRRSSAIFPLFPVLSSKNKG